MEATFTHTSVSPLYRIEQAWQNNSSGGREHTRAKQAWRSASNADFSSLAGIFVATWPLEKGTWTFQEAVGSKSWPQDAFQRG